MSDEELKQRNLELERENAKLRKANDILKEALGFFAKDRKKKRQANVTCSSTNFVTNMVQKRFADF